MKQTKTYRVTLYQAQQLKRLGFKEHCDCVKQHYNKNMQETITSSNWNHHPDHTSIPTVDQTIDWLRKHYNVIIYNAHAPFVDPFNSRIMFTYAIKWCSMKWGWNHRERIGKGKISSDINAAKRTAITLAIKWILSHKSEKKLSKQ